MAKTKFNRLTIPYSRKYQLEKTDELCWTIQEKKTNEKTGVSTWRTVSYHGTLRKACTNLAQRVTDQGDSESLIAYSDELEQVCSRMEHAVTTAIKTWENANAKT
jgi:hypothetical protein